MCREGSRKLSGSRARPLSNKWPLLPPHFSVWVRNKVTNALRKVGYAFKARADGENVLIIGAPVPSRALFHHIFADGRGDCFIGPLSSVQIGEAVAASFFSLVGQQPPQYASMPSPSLVGQQPPKYASMPSPSLVGQQPPKYASMPSPSLVGQQPPKYASMPSPSLVGQQPPQYASSCTSEETEYSSSPEEQQPAVDLAGEPVQSGAVDWRPDMNLDLDIASIDWESFTRLENV